REDAVGLAEQDLHCRWAAKVGTDTHEVIASVAVEVAHAPAVRLRGNPRGGDRLPGAVRAGEQDEGGTPVKVHQVRAAVAVDVHHEPVALATVVIADRYIAGRQCCKAAISLLEQDADIDAGWRAERDDQVLAAVTVDIADHEVPG